MHPYDIHYARTRTHMHMRAYTHTRTHMHTHTHLFRPVKVIRLIAQHSVEEIVLKRAHAKLELTNTVIEGGQVCVCVLACVVWWWEGGG